MLHQRLATRPADAPLRGITPTPSPDQPAPASDADKPSRWTPMLARYCQPDMARSLRELAVTGLPFLALWTGLVLCVRAELWWGLLLAVPTAAFLVRLFMIQHDCGHGSYFASKTANDNLGRIIGVLTLTPYAYWRRTHAAHHATTGHLDKRGFGDVPLLTVAEYRALTPYKRFSYRLVRHPLILLGLGPLVLFVFKYRLPFGLMNVGSGPWLSTMGTNLALAGLVVGVGSLVGFDTLLIAQLPVTLISGGIGIWLFYIQHQFEDAYWAREDDWDFHTSALAGSTHYDLPPLLRWLSANIGIHHVHHLASKIPFYRLGTVLDEHPELRGMSRLGLVESARCFRFALLDEPGQRMVSFREAAQLPG